MDYAKRQTWLGQYPQGSSSTNRACLIQVAKTKQEDPEKLLDLPEVDPRLLYLWDYFVEVFSGADLTYQEIESWSRLTSKEITSEEVNILKRLSRTVKTEIKNNAGNR